MDNIQSKYEERITRAFRRALQLDVSQLPNHMSRASDRGVVPGMASASPKDAQRDAIVDELCEELYDLLFKYVNLMDNLGGESMEEEQMINRVVLTLSRAGWTISLPDAGDLGGQPSAKTLLAEEVNADRRMREESTSGFQWSRDSVPDTQSHGHASGDGVRR